MKGTIDVQIKHKDGSIETRHEHNVVFDLQALFLKEFVEQPLRLLAGGMPVLRPVGMINWFNLSTELEDLTSPSWRPTVLETTGSTSTKWYLAPITRIVEAKKITMSASWTIGTPLTIRSINVPGKNLTGSGYAKCYIDKYGVLLSSGTPLLQRVLSPSDYSFTNNSFSNLYPGRAADNYWYSDLTSTTGQPMYYEFYPLANPAERFVYYIPSTGKPTSSYRLNSSAGEFGYYTNTNADIGVRIVDPATRTTLREFPMTQFDGFTEAGTNWTAYFVLVHSETKNWVLKSFSYKDASNVTKYKTKLWQIPDVATTDPIQCFSENITAPIVSSGNYLASCVNYIVDNYLRITNKEGGDSGVDAWYKITDTGELVALPGASSNVSRTTYISRTYTDNRLKVAIYTDPFPNPQSFSYTFSGYAFTPRVTAANFSTPIELAEGDVLTISYKIEVA